MKYPDKPWSDRAMHAEREWRREKDWRKELWHENERLKEQYAELREAAEWFAADGNRTIANDPMWTRLRRVLDG